MTRHVHDRTGGAGERVPGFGLGRYNRHVLTSTCTLGTLLHFSDSVLTRKGLVLLGTCHAGRYRSLGDADTARNTRVAGAVGSD